MVIVNSTKSCTNDVYPFQITQIIYVWFNVIWDIISKQLKCWINKNMVSSSDKVIGWINTQDLFCLSRRFPHSTTAITSPIPLFFEDLKLSIFNSEFGQEARVLSKMQGL